MDNNKDIRLLFDAVEMDRFIARIADAVCAEFFIDTASSPEIAFIGIQTGGIPLARRIASLISSRHGVEPPVGMLDISMYRDDFGTRRTIPMIRETLIPFDIEKRAIILVDDVLETGRSIRAALDAITDFGRPSLIRLAVLIDRGLREFPIRADYAGVSVSEPPDRRVAPEWREYNCDDAVYSTPRKKTIFANGEKIWISHGRRKTFSVFMIFRVRRYYTSSTQRRSSRRFQSAR